MKSEVSQIGRLRSVEFLRGFACFGVVAFHFMINLSVGTTSAAIQIFSDTFNEILQLGITGMRVPLFFVISGFGNHLKFARNLSRGLDASIDGRAFLHRKIVRLYPAYFSSFVVSTAVFLMFKSSFGTGISDIYPDIQSLTAEILAHLLLLHGFFSQFDAMGLNGHLWTMSREAQFYLLYPLLVGIRCRFGIMGCVVASILAMFAYFLIDGIVYRNDWQESIYVNGLSVLGYLPLWAFGMLAVEMVFGIQQGGDRFRNPLWLLAAVLCYRLSVWLSGTFSPPSILLLAFTLFCLVHFVIGLELKGYWSDNLFMRTLESTSSYSYHVYLVHFPICAMSAVVARDLGSHESLGLFLTFLAIGIASSYFCALLLKDAVDAQANRMTSKLPASQ
jgi:peptidoglycan/LPS O-acetylase OafA/YrhL